MIIDAAGERSEQGRFLSERPGSSNAVLDCPARGSIRADWLKRINDLIARDRWTPVSLDVSDHGIVTSRMPARIAMIGVG
jgi:hypothetical protein